MIYGRIACDLFNRYKYRWVAHEGGAIPPGGSFVYEFIAKPYGVFPYHCHVEPIADHINRGLYGMLIIDPKTPRPQMTEFAMLMNGYDLNFDQEGPVTIPTAQESNDDQQISKAVLVKDHQQPQDKGDIVKNKKLKQTPPNADNQDVPANVDDVQRDNEIYTVNGKAFDYMTHPIPLQTGKPYRIYLVNMLELNSNMIIRANICSMHIKRNLLTKDGWDYLKSWEPPKILLLD